MKDIKELFEKIYGIKNPNEEQMEIFIDSLKRRLTVRELEYVTYTYGVDLIGFEEVEKNIAKWMKHPIIVKEIQEAGDDQKDEIDAVYEKVKDKEYISISYIQRTFSMGFISASKTFNAMLERKMILPEQSKRGYRINKEYKS